jgi:hypothetical protein
LVWTIKVNYSIQAEPGKYFFERFGKLRESPKKIREKDEGTQAETEAAKRTAKFSNTTDI